MKAFLTIAAILSGLAAISQCYPDRHNTSWNEAWISCETRTNPNPDRGSGHWILYDFANTYRLGSMKIWNLNATGYLDDGIRDFHLDYSRDGMKWHNLGQFTLSQASGESIYEGEEITSFGADTARFVLLTAIDTWGGNCAGISEMKIDVIEVVEELHFYNAEECFEVSVYPNPHETQFNLSILAKCNGTIDYGLFDHTGKRVLQGQFPSDENIKLRQINTGDLPSGLYHLILHQNRSVARYPVMKI